MKEIYVPEVCATAVTVVSVHQRIVKSIWGITQLKIVDGRIVEEWMMFNEMDPMIQIAAARK